MPRPWQIQSRRTPRLVRSVQRGVIVFAGATSGTGTITGVDVNNSVIRHLGMGYDGHTTDWSHGTGRVELTNGTTVTAYITNNTGSNIHLSYEVTEYWPGVLRSVQRGSITWATGSGSPGTATILPVELMMAELSCLGFTMSATPQVDEGACWLTLTNATTVTATKVAAVITDIVGYQVIEWN